MLQQIPENYYKVLLNLISNGGHNDYDSKLEFLGLLQGENLNINSVEIIEKLIEKRIYVEDPSLKDYFVDNELVDFTTYSNYTFGIEGLYKNKSYTLNPDLYKEIYDVVKFIIENSFEYSLLADKHSVVCQLLGFLTNEEKIKFLKEKYKESWLLGEERSLFLLFMDKWNGVENNYVSWYDHIYDCLTYDGKFIAYFLSASSFQLLDDSSFFETDYRRWLDFYRLKKLQLFIKSEIDELQNSSSNGKSRPGKKKEFKAEEFFTAGGLEMFDLIVKHWKDEKNQAFFSDIYHYLRSKGKLNTNTKTSEGYTNYVLNRFPELVSFSRVIPKSNLISSANTSRYVKFAEILKDYSLNKS